jgi:hypothetical protein
MLLRKITTACVYSRSRILYFPVIMSAISIASFGIPWQVAYRYRHHGPCQLRQHYSDSPSEIMNFVKVTPEIIRRTILGTYSTVIFTYFLGYLMTLSVARLHIVERMGGNIRKNLEEDSKGFRRWCITFRITGFLDFLHRPDF